MGVSTLTVNDKTADPACEISYARTSELGAHSRAAGQFKAPVDLFSQNTHTPMPLSMTSKLRTGRRIRRCREVADVSGKPVISIQMAGWHKALEHALRAHTPGKAVGDCLAAPPIHNPPHERCDSPAKKKERRKVAI